MSTASQRIVAIVGRPNVGKSRLFNRLARRRISIVHDQPGVTRDVISTEIEEGQYTLLDTGGIGYKGVDTPAALTKASEQQVDFAMATATVILFVVDGLSGLSGLDERIAQSLRRSKKKVLLVVNKADFDDDKIALDEAYRLGLGEPLRVSAEHGRGEAELRDAIAAALGPVPEEASDAAVKTAKDPLCICFIGRPNVGKSSLSNRLLRSDRLIVSDVPGTTRDAIELPFEFEGRDGRMYPFRLIDTAGIKAAAKLASPVEYFSRLRSFDAIKKTDVVFLVLDALEGVTQQDKAIAGEAIKEGKPIVIVVNKWDLVQKAFKEQGGFEPYESERDYREKYEHALFQHLFFTPGSPVIFVSAMNGYEVDRMLNAAVKLNRVLDKKLPTAKLNQQLAFLTERTPPPSVGSQRFRVYYGTQTGNRPFRIRLFCNREEKLTESYRRYLEAGLVEEFGLAGCPIYFDLVGKPRREHEPTRPSVEATRQARAAERRPAWKKTDKRGPRAERESDAGRETLED
ncbi:ribosome biogenesis GTPase Der [Opitutus sp. ER46]|uniref:ribosome biogenesis GTPase Der n=1 Tax=Opitutus sp. ER46 TaxID=2161864 RepID=UPI000D313AB9|nr:ribosome biogenesis GTPase Der [Opitutus sp. ER46]PTX94227.1 ribosome biogenesis GTPase Der [Opitutus sp. ER46]